MHKEIRRILLLLWIFLAQSISGIAIVDGGIYWEIVFKVSSGGSFRVYDMYSDKSALRNSENLYVQRLDLLTTQHVKTEVINNWASIQQVRLSVFDNYTEQAFFVFDATNLDKFSWFDRVMVLNTSYILPSHTMQYFDIYGYSGPEARRSFYIAETHDTINCNNTIGFFGIIDESYTGPCDLDNVDTMTVFYSPFTNPTNGFEIADSMVMSVARVQYDGYRYSADMNILYNIYTQRRKKPEYEQICQADGGRLLRITSIQKLVSLRQDPLFITYIQGMFVDGTDRDLTGNWIFSNGEPIPGSVLDLMTPFFDNFLGNEYILEMKRSENGFDFNDVIDGQDRGAICEIPVACGDPPLIQNGVVGVGDDRIFAKRVVLCLEGYIPYGSSEIVCGLDGEWSNVSCIAVLSSSVCDLTTVTLHDSMVINDVIGNISHVTLSMSCKDNYVYFSGDYQMTCISNNWNGQALVCNDSSIARNISEVLIDIKKTQSDLIVMPKSTTKYQRTKISAKDHRMSSKFIGVIGACVIVIVCAMPVLSDLSNYCVDFSKDRKDSRPSDTGKSHKKT